ncbi:MAG: hypothetical protein ACOC2J_00280 [bacterium]
MEFKGFKLKIILVVVILVLGLFFSGQYLNEVYNVDKPIKDDILALEGIRDVSIIDNNDKVDLHIEFKPGIDFYTLYQTITNIMDDRLGERSGNVVIAKNNQSNSNLDDIYYELHFAIYQGINTGRFVEMEENIKVIVDKSDLDNYKIWVDNQSVFIQLDRNDESIYKRISYNSQLNIEGGGSIG